MEKKKNEKSTRHGRNHPKNSGTMVTHRKRHPTPLRRSPRLHPNGGGPNPPVAGETQVIRSKTSPSTPFSGERKKTHLDWDLANRVVVGCSSAVCGSVFAANGRRRSARFCNSAFGGVVGGLGEKGFDGSGECENERSGGSPVRRTSKRGVVGKKRKVESVDGEGIVLVGGEGEADVARNLSTPLGGGWTMGSGRKMVGSVALMQRKRKEKMEIVVRRMENVENMLPGSANLSTKSDVGRSVLVEIGERKTKKKSTSIISMTEERIDDKGNKKRNVSVRKSEEGCGSMEWSNEQDKALHRAYLLARPSPHFWKQISKMVPGKSAKECFDRVHSNHVTPPLPLPRSRVKRKNMSPLIHFSLGSHPDEFLKENVGKTRGKQQKLLSQKTARYILRKHSLVDQGQEADMFSVFETSINQCAIDAPYLQLASTSNGVMNSASSVQRSGNDLPIADKTAAMRFMALDEKKKPSPEVLKKVKNMKLHEKYIDQLHHRDAKRKFSVTSANYANKRHGKENMVPKTIVVKAAKNALLSEAREVIGQFQHKQANFPIKYFDSDDSDKSEYDDSPT